ncbi:hypothetical protein [Bacillus sp. 3255]|uniref:hypothetical protein n=1 Tax=Bacillus sp. 3255 TaxID=2817904 RepID=UPI00285BA557|nr:hypothetical protein [Bacillus sp. 3255]MDR6884317.1 hypothetical protein [Bacillus sp. 3255]
MCMSFSRTVFEYELDCIIKPPRRARNVTVESKIPTTLTMELIYEVRTDNPSVVILVFSSVDIWTNRTREKGGDFVRLIMRWKTEKGFKYRHLDSIYRDEKLFYHMAETIDQAKSEVFYCEDYKWTSLLEIVL